jgi:hypothetical protein
MNFPALPSLAYLLDCSVASLQDLELENLNLSSECVRKAKTELEEAIARREAAGVARWLIEHRDEFIDMAKRVADGKQRLLKFPELPGVRKSA